MPFALHVPEGPDADLLIYGMLYHPRCEEISYRIFWECTGTVELKRVFPKYSWSGKKGLRLQDDLRVRYYRSFYDDSAAYHVRRFARVWVFTFKAANSFEEKLTWIDHMIEVHELEIKEGKGPTPEEYAESCGAQDGPWRLPPGHHLAFERMARRSLIKRNSN